jgi:hypothetical protein
MNCLRSIHPSGGVYRFPPSDAVKRLRTNMPSISTAAERPSRHVQERIVPAVLLSVAVARAQRCLGAFDRFETAAELPIPASPNTSNDTDFETFSSDPQPKR